MDKSQGATPFKRWYAKNSTELNANRKQRYHSDPEYRDKVLARQREARRNNPRALLQAEHTYRVTPNGKVEVFRIGTLVSKTGRTEKTIRAWEAKGYIPEPTISGGHRYYTSGQVGLVKEFSALMDQVRYEKALKAFKIQSKSNDIHSRWEEAL